MNCTIHDGQSKIKLSYVQQDQYIVQDMNSATTNRWSLETGCMKIQVAQTQVITGQVSAAEQQVLLTGCTAHVYVAIIAPVYVAIAASTWA